MHHSVIIERCSSFVNRVQRSPNHAQRSEVQYVPEEAYWTSLAPPDPFLVVAAGNTVLRWKDLQQLVQFLRQKQTQHQEDH